MCGAVYAPTIDNVKFLRRSAGGGDRSRDAVGYRTAATMGATTSSSFDELIPRPPNLAHSHIQESIDKYCAAFAVPWQDVPYVTSLNQDADPHVRENVFSRGAGTVCKRAGLPRMRDVGRPAAVVAIRIEHSRKPSLVVASEGLRLEGGLQQTSALCQRSD